MKNRARSWQIPLALLALCLLSFGPLLPTLGFYWDDWPYLLINMLQGPEGYQQFFALDRPTTFVSYLLLMPVFGVEPLAWQLFTLLLRWGCAVLVWVFARQMWPGASALALWSAALFAIYPVFRQQPIALTYHQLWMEHVFFLASLVAMLLAARQPHRRTWWSVLALLAMALNLLISEYFLGAELLRPFILWLALAGSGGEARFLRWKRAALGYLPYLLVLLAYMAWRFVFLELPGEDRNALTLLTTLRADPLSGTILLAQMALQDTIHILAAAWYSAFDPQIFDFSGRFGIFAIAWSVLVAGVSAAFLWLRQRAAVDAQHETAGWQALLLGLLLVLVSPLPGWVTGRQVTVGAWSDRLAVPAMLGASLFLAGLLAWLARRPWQGLMLVSLLVGLAAGAHLRNANDYRWASIQQNRFFWQLYWRAPQIARETALFAEAEVLPKTGLYSTAMGINMIYGSQGEDNTLPYWFFSLSREYPQQINELASGMPVQGGLRQWSFNGQSSDSLIVYYEPAEAGCLRLVTPRDGGDPALSALERGALPMVDLQRIGVQPVAPPDARIFGPEPAHDWCYLFQKADLARQQGDWQAVAALGSDAQARGYTLENSESNTAQEWLPFLQGYAHTGALETATALTRQMLEREPKMAPYLCAVWDDLRAELPNAQTDPQVQQVWEVMGCGQ